RARSPRRDHRTAETQLDVEQVDLANACGTLAEARAILRRALRKARRRLPSAPPGLEPVAVHRAPTLVAGAQAPIRPARLIATPSSHTPAVDGDDRRPPQALRDVRAAA